MPQLVPFYFLNQITFAFILLIVMVYIFSKYILPRFVRLFNTRVFISKLYSLERALNSPPKPHAFTSLSVQSGFIDIASLITSFPIDIKDSILGHLGASYIDIKNQTDLTVSNLARLDVSHQICTEMFPQDGPERHIGVYNSVSKDISKLIHMKGLYESITKDHSHVNSCIENLNGKFIHKQNTDEMHSIKDLITNLESYKVDKPDY